MSYRMERLTDQLRVGRTSDGEANIEFWTPAYNHPDGHLEWEVFIPAQEVEELAKWLMQNF